LYILKAFIEGGGLEDEDPNRYIEAPRGARSAVAKSGGETTAAGEELERTRTYDLHITYDKYYQVYLTEHWTMYKI
jgi:hypothetical protein